MWAHGACSSMVELTSYTRPVLGSNPNGPTLLNVSRRFLKVPCLTPVLRDKFFSTELKVLVDIGRLNLLTRR